MKRSAFTLVELLVVVSIIALLISLLLPALRNAKAAANSTVCLSQMRQTALGTLTYTTDHRGSLPYRYFQLKGVNGWPSWGHIAWNDLINPYLDGPEMLWTQVRAQPVGILKLPLLRCPEYDPAVAGKEDYHYGPKGKKLTGWYISVRANASVFKSANQGVTPNKLPQTFRLSEIGSDTYLYGEKRQFIGDGTFGVGFAQLGPGGISALVGKELHPSFTTNFTIANGSAINLPAAKSGGGAWSATIGD